MAFIIDENAFELLHNYLEALKRKFSNETERDEILNDIESRIGELLNQKIADRKEVVSVAEVQAVMDAMGKPEDIASLVSYLMSDEASFINGENIIVDGGMSKQMIYHGDEGWEYHNK